MESRPQGVRIALVLLAANSLLWLAFSVLTAAGAHPSFGGQSAYRWPAAALAFALAAGLGVLSLLLRAPSRLGYWATAGLLLGIIFMLFLDQFGIADLAVAVIAALPLILLVRDRAWYLRRGAGKDHGIA